MSKGDLYIAASAQDAPDNFPAVLRRLAGSISFVEVHRNSTPGNGVNGTGFSGISGAHNAAGEVFVVAVGSAVYKASNAPIMGALSYLEDGAWSDATVPAGYRLVDVYVPEVGVAYVCGYDVGTQQTARIWRWTSDLGFVEVYSRNFATTFKVSYYHITGTGPNDIRATLAFISNAVYSPANSIHFDGNSWTEISAPWQIQTEYPVNAIVTYGSENTEYFCIASGNYDENPGNDTYWHQRHFLPYAVPESLVGRYWGNGLSEWYGGKSFLYEITDLGSSFVHIFNEAGNEIPYGCVGTDAYMLAAAFAEGSNRIYKWTTVGIVSKTSTGFRYQRLARAANGLDVLALANNLSGGQSYVQESADGGETWSALVALSGYDWAAGAFFDPGPPPTTSLPEPGLRPPLKIYPFIIQSIRDADRDDGDLLVKRWTEGMDVQWEAIDRKIRELATLIDPETCPSEAVAYLGWIVGLTKSLEGLTGGISESDYRQLIAIAVRAWKKKGSGLGLVETIKSISGYDVRYLTWFFFRIILDEFELGHAEFDVDPWLLDQPGMTPSVAPDAIIVERILRGDVLPSAADPVWTYSNEGAVEGATFAISSGRIAQTQTDGLGGRYFRDDTPNLLDPETAEVAAVLRIESKTVIGGTPWFIELEDGVRGYRFSLSDGVVVLQDVAGNTVAGPRSRGFVVGTEYRLRIVRTGPTTVDVTIDGSSVFGEQEISDFAASANKRYGFGYRDEGVTTQDWVISWREVGPKPVLRFDLSTLLGLTEAVPHNIRVVYRENVGRTAPSYWTGSRNEVSVNDALGVPIPLDLEIGNFRVGVDPDEFVSDLRVVDDGTLDQDFVARLVGVLRPAGERIFVRFVDFQDVFRNKDLRYWEEISGTTVPRPDDGRADLEDGGADTVIHADMPLAAVWRQFTLAAQFALRDPVVGNWGEVRFHVADALNFYAVRIDPGARTVALQRVIAGVRTTIFTHGPMDIFYPDVLYTVHVTTEDVVGGVLMKVYLDGNYLGEAIDAAFDEGTIGLAVATGQRLSVSFVDLVSCPFSSARVGPGIDADPTWNNSCANP